MFGAYGKLNSPVAEKESYNTREILNENLRSGKSLFNFDDSNKTGYEAEHIC